MELFSKILLTKARTYGIISRSQDDLGVAQLVARYLGVVEAASSSLVTQTSSEVHNEPPNFLYFTGFFGLFGVCTASKTSAIFLLKIGSKLGMTTCLTTCGDFCTFLGYKKVQNLHLRFEAKVQTLLIFLD